ncbi:MAG: FHA domain-containing protein, partial [Gemmatimonadetes bacterium]|nr:FHA domain-containing protein [Gemmatimonadota bacterium]
MPPRLTILTGPHAGAAVPLGHQPVTFGRKPDRTLTFGQEEIVVSAEHATIEWREGRHFLTDDGSTNGTFVNGEQVWNRVLEDGDVVQFGAGGPAGRFELEPGEGSTPTLDTGLLVPRRTQPAGPLPQPSAGRRTTRELMTLSLDRFTARTRRWLLVGAALLVVAIAAVAFWQQRTRAQLERALLALSVSLTAERASRAMLERDLGAIQSRYDSLRKLVAAEQRARAGEGGSGPAVLRDYSRAVPLIIFTYGFVEQGGTELLRYAVDLGGEMIGPRGPDGRLVPAIRFGGDGPPVTHEGTATGFLIDTAGRVLTNRHVAEPWNYDGELEEMRGRGIPADGRLMELRAYFPPGDQAFKLGIETISARADVAVLRVLDGRVQAPVIPLAPGSSVLQPGERLRLIGYPTGVYNLLFRVDETTRGEILHR